MPAEPVSRRQQVPLGGRLKAEPLGLWKSLGPTFITFLVIFKYPKKLLALTVREVSLPRRQ